MSSFLQQKPIILASGSAIRKKILESSGLEFSVIVSNCDEDTLKNDFREKNWIELGHLLAKAKALEVSQNYPEHFVIAADQLCILEEKLLGKSLTMENAFNQLSRLQNQQHLQIACVCIAKKGKILWRYQDIATLHMHALTTAQIKNYLNIEKPFNSCGSYQYEGLGKWLFKQIEGQEYTILGLPLQQVVNALLELKIVQFC